MSALFLQLSHSSCCRLCLCRLQVVGILNFVIFLFVAIIIGGDAISGHAAAGHYYVANHGKLTEVSYLVFVYSKMHAMSVFFTHPLTLIAGIVYFVTGGKQEDFWKPKSTKSARN